MSFPEIKEEVANLSPEQRLELAGLIAHLEHADDLQYRAHLDRQLAEMNAGKKLDGTDLERLHRELIGQGH